MGSSGVAAGVAECAIGAAREPAGHGRRCPHRLPQAGARLVRFRDGRRGHAARERRPRRYGGESCRPHPQHEETPARRRPADERAADGQQRGHDGVDSRSAAAAWRTRGRARAGIPRSRAARHPVRHRVRRGDRRHAVVRRSLSARGAAQPGSAVPAALRHGPRVGPRQSAAHRDLHVDHVCRHARLPTQTSRRRAAHTRRVYWS